MLNILQVEDNPGDVVLLQEIVHIIDENIRVHVTTSVDEALAFLTRTPPFAEAPAADLVLLDFNMPGSTGDMLLSRVKSALPIDRRPPIVVFTSSANPVDRALSLSLGASAYVVKPLELHDFYRTIANLMRVHIPGA